MENTFNPNELILDRIRSLTYHDLGTGELIMRMTSLEDVTLTTTAEGDEVTDAVGALITTIYRSKKAKLAGSNSVISLGLAGVQYGSDKEVASATNKITDYTYEILQVVDGKVTLKHEPKDAVKYIYSINNREIGTTYTAGATASETEFVIDGKEITVPTGLTGKIYVEYTYDAERAVRVKNDADKFPKAGSIVVYAYFKDVCNENLVYSGKIICPKAKINPESIELALNSTGKHAFEFNMMKDYCSEENNELFSIVVAES